MSPEQIKFDRSLKNKFDFRDSLSELYDKRPQIWDLIDRYLDYHTNNRDYDEVNHIVSAIRFEDAEFADIDVLGELNDAVERGESTKFELRLHRSSTFSVARIYNSKKSRWFIEKLALRRDWPDTFTPQDKIDETSRLLSELRLACPEAFNGFVLEQRPHIAELLGKIATIAK